MSGIVKSLGCGLYGLLVNWDSAEFLDWMNLATYEIFFTDATNLEGDVSGKQRTADDASEVQAMIQKKYPMARARYFVLKNDG